MKKRALSLLLALVMCLGLLPMTALAADEDDFTIKDGKLTKYNGPGGDVVIPEGVTKIGWMAFDSCTTLTSVTFPNGVTSIGNAAFNGCTSLTRVTFPDSLDYIDTDAFSNCPSLDELVIPDSVTRYGNSVSNSVRKLTFGSGLADPLRDGNSGWLLNNKNLTSLTIRGRVQTIDHEVFIACRNLTEIHYSGTVKEWREALDIGAFRTVYDPNAYSNAMWCIPNATVYCSDGTIAAGTGNVRASDADSSSDHGGDSSDYGGGSSDHGGGSQGAPQIGYLFLAPGHGQLPGSSKLEFIVGQPLGELPTPTREGYRFDGWYTADIGGSRVTSSTTVQTDFLTLTAHWTNLIPEEVTLYFNSNGGSSVPERPAFVGEPFGPLPTPTREGYTFDGWYTARKGGSKVTSSTILSEAVNEILFAHWTKGTQAPAPEFTDVPASEFFAEPVQWAVEKGITAGTSATKFSPASKCNRAQILSFLYRASGSPEPTIANPFTDLKETDFYYKAALWAAEKGIVSGTTFDALTRCTRASTMEYMWKAAGSPKASYDGRFADVAADSDYAQAVAWALEHNVTAGTSKTKFSPNSTCTRGQIVTFLHRAFAE